MREETFKVVNIKEIEDEDFVKKEIDRVREVITEDNFDVFSEDAPYILYFAYGIDLTSKDIHYSLCYCQGDGFCFDYEDFLYNKYFRDKVNKELTKGEKISLSKMIKDGLKIISKNDCHYGYCYASANDIGVDFENWEYSKTTEKQDKIIEKVKKIITSEYLSICKELENEGYKCYEVSDEDCSDFMIENEYEYIKTGGGYVRI